MAAVDKQTALVPADDSTKIVAIKSNEFKVPKPRRKKVLEEDEYEEVGLCIYRKDSLSYVAQHPIMYFN